MFSLERSFHKQASMQVSTANRLSRYQVLKKTRSSREFSSAMEISKQISRESCTKLTLLISELEPFAIRTERDSLHGLYDLKSEIFAHHMIRGNWVDNPSRAQDLIREKGKWKFTLKGCITTTGKRRRWSRILGRILRIWPKQVLQNIELLLGQWLLRNRRIMHCSSWIGTSFLAWLPVDWFPMNTPASVQRVVGLLTLFAPKSTIPHMLMRSGSRRRQRRVLPSGMVENVEWKQGQNRWSEGNEGSPTSTSGDSPHVWPRRKLHEDQAVAL